MPEIIKKPIRIVYYFLRKHKNTITLFLRKWCYSNPYQYLSLSPADLNIQVMHKEFVVSANFPEYSIITPVLNEEKNILELLRSIEAQTYKPAEIIIIDGGSTDSTIDKIQSHQKSSSLNIILIFSEVKNIGYQRNIGIKQAKYDIIMNVDAGTRLDKNYSANAIGPFHENPALDLVCGVHYPHVQYPWSESFSPVEHFKDRQDPYGACLVYKKDTAIKIGLYPEYLTYAGEDTLFAYKYRKVSKEWVFNKAAFIYWEHPETLEEAQEKISRYTKANFEIGLWPYFYTDYSYLLKFKDRYLFWIKFDFAGYLGLTYKNFLEYQKDQAQIETKRRHIEGVCFVLSEAPIDHKEASKAREIAVAYTQKNYKVFFIFNKNITTERPKRFFDVDHTLLEIVYYKDFCPIEFKERYGCYFDNALFITKKNSPLLTMPAFKSLMHNAKVDLEDAHERVQYPNILLMTK